MEKACAQRSATLGNVAATCPPLRLQPGQLRSMKASRYHLGATSDELVRWLAPHANEPLLFFGRMFRRFHRFSVNADDATFRRRYAEGVQPAPEIRAVASRALRTLRSAVGGDGNFDCVHMRRRDFVADHASEEISVEEYARRAAEKLRAVKKAQPPAKHKRNDKRHGERKHHGESTNSESEEMFDVAIYLASDVAELPETKAAFGRYFRAVYSLEGVFPHEALDTFTTFAHLSRANRSVRSKALASEMRFGNVDQLLCSAAEQFVGNKWSSFTHHVCYLRQQLGMTRACSGSDIYGRDIDAQMDYW
eukprot:CAMPEP_0115889040 /NCGR_PEP_ID=MMETSP0287-20121206/32618_1 /TAXON_ID=412157 /ORGANISM="Chrysochromulina rotalis, Strain UIO044" /LENGTH=306 /DNA_ID=CAMNT_0003345743 /DNA_START=149 /DNA_END=1066 /DNA_ORIENTATION=+